MSPMASIFEESILAELPHPFTEVWASETGPYFHAETPGMHYWWPTPDITGDDSVESGAAKLRAGVDEVWWMWAHQEIACIE